MTAAIDTAPAPGHGDQDHDDSLTHYYCCDENQSLCGVDLTDVPVGSSDDDLLCIVCTDLNGLPCRTGCCRWWRP